jgi:hypothetical protein
MKIARQVTNKRQLFLLAVGRVHDPDDHQDDRCYPDQRTDRPAQDRDNHYDAGKDQANQDQQALLDVKFHERVVLRFCQEGNKDQDAEVGDYGHASVWVLAAGAGWPGYRHWLGGRRGRRALAGACRIVVDIHDLG